MYQKDVAVQIGVTTSTSWNWDHGWTFDLRYMPRIIEFLGYNPIPCPDNILERLAWYKQVNGLTFEDLGAEMSRDPEQLADWLSGRHKPFWRNLEKIELFLSDHVQDPGAALFAGTEVPEESVEARGSMKSFMARTTSEKSSGT